MSSSQILDLPKKFKTSKLYVHGLEGLLQIVNSFQQFLYIWKAN